MEQQVSNRCKLNSSLIYNTYAGFLSDFIFFPTSGMINSSTEILCHSVTIIADTIVEENEYFNITLSGYSFVLNGGPITIVITDDDGKSILQPKVPLLLLSKLLCTHTHTPVYYNYYYPLLKNIHKQLSWELRFSELYL